MTWMRRSCYACKFWNGETCSELNINTTSDFACKKWEKGSIWSIGEHRLTHAQVEHAKSLGLTRDAVYARHMRGKSIEYAMTHVKQKR
jgi:hypothetical protein